MEHKTVSALNAAEMDWREEDHTVLECRSVWQYEKPYTRRVSKIYVDGEEWSFEESRHGVEKSWLDCDLEFDGETAHIIT